MGTKIANNRNKQSDYFVYYGLITIKHAFTKIGTGSDDNKWLINGVLSKIGEIILDFTRTPTRFTNAY